MTWSPRVRLVPSLVRPRVGQLIRNCALVLQGTTRAQGKHAGFRANLRPGFRITGCRRTHWSCGRTRADEGAGTCLVRGLANAIGQRPWLKPYARTYVYILRIVNICMYLCIYTYTIYVHNYMCIPRCMHIYICVSYIYTNIYIYIYLCVSISGSTLQTFLYPLAARGRSIGSNIPNLVAI